MKLTNPTESDFMLLIQQALVSDEEADYGSYELALKVAERVDVKSPAKFAQTAALLMSDDLYLEEVIDKAYKITKIWETQ